MDKIKFTYNTGGILDQLTSNALAIIKILKVQLEPSKKNVLPIKTYKFTVDHGFVIKPYLQNGWPILIPGSSRWFFIENVTPKKEIMAEDLYGPTLYSYTNYTFTITVPLNYKLENVKFITPLNQFDRGIENEDIIEYNKNFDFKILQMAL